MNFVRGLFRVQRQKEVRVLIKFNFSQSLWDGNIKFLRILRRFSGFLSPIRYSIILVTF